MNNKTVMKQKSSFHFHKGHYLKTNISDSLSKVKNERYSEINCKDEDAADYLYEDADVFLHGSCNLFALAIHDLLGYPVYEVLDYQGCMSHVFCKAEYHGQEVYVDVRGATTDITECLSEFEGSLRKGYTIRLRDLEEDRKLDCEGDRTGFAFAKAVVEKNKDYYDVSL